MGHYPPNLRFTADFICPNDVNIRCGDIIFEGHRTILAINSLYLKTLFRQQPVGDFTIIPRDINCTPMALMSLLDSIYTARFHFDVERIELLAAAFFLQMNNAIEEIIDDITGNINIAKFLKEWKKVKKYGDADHEKKMIKSLAIQFQTLIGSEQFVDLTRNQLVLILIDTNQLSTSKDRIIQGILKWINHEKERRGVYLQDLLSFIDIEEFPMLSVANLTEEDPIGANNLVSILCKKMWRRDEVIIHILKTTDEFEGTNFVLQFLDSITNSWLLSERALPKKMMTERSICNWRNYIYSINKTSIIVYNIETERVSETMAELSCYEQDRGTLIAKENVFYYAINKRLEKYDLKSNEKTWISLPNAPNDFANSNVFCYREFVYVINGNLLIQKFDPKTEIWMVFDHLMEKSDELVMYEKLGKIYMVTHAPDVLRILNLDLMFIEVIKVKFCCSVDSTRLIFIQELKLPGLFSLLLLDVHGGRWSQLLKSLSDVNEGEIVSLDKSTACIKKDFFEGSFLYKCFHGNVNVKSLTT